MSETPPTEDAPNFSHAGPDSHVVSEALDKIQAEEAGTQFTPLTAVIMQLKGESSATKLEITEVETLVETLDRLVQKIQDGGVRDCCLRTLSEVCRANVILPKSHIISGIPVEKEWQRNGRFADILKGELEQKTVCIKVFRKHDEMKQAKIQGAFYYHIIGWKYLAHDNVLPFLGVSEVLPPFCFISPWMPGNNIVKYTRENQDADRLGLLANAACGLKYLHSSNIVHGGISPGNILITAEGTACIGDFGIAEIITDPLVAEQCGTTTCRRGIIRYMAPEQVSPSEYGLANSNAVKATDIHSFAMTAYEVLTEIEPYSGITGDGPLTERIVGDARPSRPEDPAAVRRLPDPIWQMMESCWAPDPKSRASIKEVHQAFLNSVAKADGTATEDEQAGTLPDPQQYETKTPSKRGLRPTQLQQAPPLLPPALAPTTQYQNLLIDLEKG